MRLIVDFIHLNRIEELEHLHQTCLKTELSHILRI